MNKEEKEEIKEILEANYLKAETVGEEEILQDTIKSIGYTVTESEDEWHKFLNDCGL